MKLRELLQELSFMGSKCTKDCSGHRAGWDWERRMNTRSPSMTHSQSFNNGTRLAIDNPTKKPSVRDEKGKFAKNPTRRRFKENKETLVE